MYARVPEIAVDLRKLPDCAIDGELVVLDESGKPEFHQLRGRCAIRDPERVSRAAVSKPAAVFAFDVLQLRGKDMRALPLLKRKAALQKELRRTERIVYCQHVGGRGGKKLYARRARAVSSKDIQTYKRAQGSDIKRRAKAEKTKKKK